MIAVRRVWRHGWVAKTYFRAGSICGDWITATEANQSCTSLVRQHTMQLRVAGAYVIGSVLLTYFEALHVDVSHIKRFP